MFLELSSICSHYTNDYRGISEAMLCDNCVDTYHDCILNGSSFDYSVAYSKCKSKRPREWFKKVVLSIDTSVYANQCLLYSWPNSSYLVGSSLNWSPRKCPSEHPTNKSSYSQSNDIFDSINEGIILQSRGFNVYGHWLLDYLPRLLIIKEYCNACPDLPIIVRNIPVWAKDFMLRLGITNPILSVPAGGELRVKLLHIPLIMKEGFAYYEPMLAKSFFTIRRLFNLSDVYKITNFPEKIFLARRKRPYALNQDEAIDFYSKYGFQCVYPESLSLDDQIAMYSTCRAFIGEDSSAMHNIGFAINSSSLIFSRMNRINLWHAAVASATGQFIRPIQSLIHSNDGKYSIPLNGDYLNGF
jgi:hypothetical protein